MSAYFSLGNEKNVEKSGSSDYSAEEGICIHLKTGGDKTFDIVFDSFTEGFDFVCFVGTVSSDNNVTEFKHVLDCSEKERPRPSVRMSDVLSDGIVGGRMVPGSSPYTVVEADKRTPLPTGPCSVAGTSSSNSSTANTDNSIQFRRADSSSLKTLGGGVFRKLGSNVKAWRLRNYTVRSADTKTHAILEYYDAVTNEAKGSLLVTSVQFEAGDAKHLQDSGCADFSTEEGVSLCLIGYMKT